MRTVAALKLQLFSNFELCLVAGPTEDGTAEFGKELQQSGHAKFAQCSVANLSVSRNLGLELAAGDLVAFIDDDAVPEPVWLQQLVPLFSQSNVAGASGTVFHPNSRDIQFRYSLCDRFGEAVHLDAPPPPERSFPMSNVFQHVMGANCIFRRNQLLAIGGFDEEYEYYLDEADLCCRLVDDGKRLVHGDLAPVHHKYLSGTTRDASGITVRRKAIVKNQIYFSIMNGRHHTAMRELIAKCEEFTQWHRADIEQHVSSARLPPSALDQFDKDVEEAWDIGLSRGLSGNRSIRETFVSPEPFLPFPVSIDPSTCKHIAVLQLEQIEDRHPIKTLAQEGHIVRSFEPLTDLAIEAEGADFIGGVWLHRVASGEELGLDARTLPEAVHHRASLRSAMERVACYHPFDKVIELRL